MPSGIEIALTERAIAPVVAGIDEAGYGPILGPLVVCCTCFHPTENGADDHLGRRFSNAGLRVGDSKKIYSSRGLAALEEVILAAAGVIGCERIDTLGQLTDLVAPTLSTDPLPWYDRRRELPLPVAADAARVADATALLSRAVGRGSFDMRAEILSARRFNEEVAELGNKSDLLFALCGRHLLWLDETVASRRAVRVICDKLGGRKFYARPLGALLGGGSVEVLSEESERSRYRLGRMEVAFQQEADAAYPCVGLASMLAKYLRELFLLLLNRWWCREVPDLKPTAGYWTDGTRFLREIAPRRAALGIPDCDLVRSL